MLMTQTGYDYDTAIYYRARYYSPTIGRFMSEDPIGQVAHSTLLSLSGDVELDCPAEAPLSIATRHLSPAPSRGTISP